MMNFVDTAPVTAPRIAAVEGADAVVEKTVAACQKRAFGLSFLLTVAVFSFTLLGLITTTNYITDAYVIPTLYGQKVAELQVAPSPMPETTEAAVETTSAR